MLAAGKSIKSIAFAEGRLVMSKASLQSTTEDTPKLGDKREDSYRGFPRFTIPEPQELWCTPSIPQQ